MSSNEAPNISDCLLCLEEMTLGVLSVISCGHVYHYECIQRMYLNDREYGKKSSCPACRQAIISVPNKIYGKYSSEIISCSIVTDEHTPNISGRKGQHVPAPHSQDSRNGNNSLLMERIEFYEGRLADLEAQLEDYEEIEEEVHRLTSENNTLKGQHEQNKIKILELAQKLDHRDKDMFKILILKRQMEKKLEVEKKNITTLETINSELSFELNALKLEIASYQDSKLSLETERLASEISQLQTESYFKNLEKYHNQEEIIGLLAGMHVKFKDSENEKTEIERENRKLRIEKEQLLRRLRLNEPAQFSINKNKSVMPVSNNDSGDETELENEHGDEDEDENKYENEHRSLKLIKRTPPPKALNVSKLVPSVRPKSLMIPQRSSGITTGTGKRSKIIEMPDGSKRII